MKKFHSLLILLVSAFISTTSLAQPWTYDYGTGTGSYAVASGASTTLLTSTPSGGGTYRVRCASAGNFGAGVILANPGTTLGTNSELQINASLTTSTNKFGVYDWTSPSTVAYLKTKIRTTSSTSGNLAICFGVNTVASGNNGYTGDYNNSVTTFSITYASGAISAVNRRISGSNVAITGSGFAKDTDQEIEIYANNGASSTTYTKNSTSYTLNSQTWDLWVGGTKISPANGWAKAGTLTAGLSISGFAFYSESSTTNAAYIYLDDLEYSNSFPACTAPSTQASNITFSGLTTSEMDVSWSSGNGAGRVVKINTSNSFTAPTNGSNPTANLAWQNAGEQVVYNGTGSGPITITGLSQNTTYYYQVFEYCDSERIYQTATATGNPNSQATASGPGLSASTLTSFGAQCTGNDYGPNMFTITGSNLTLANVTVTTSIPQYTFSTTGLNGSFQSSLSLTQAGGAYSQDIYVLFSPSAVATYNGNIVVGGGGASSINVAVTGSGIASAAPTVANAASSLITTTTATLGADITSLNCSNVTYRGIEWSTVNNFVNGTGTLVDESGTFGTGSFAMSVTGLPANTVIYWKAFAQNGTGTTTTTQQSFTTAQEYLTVGDISIIAMNTTTDAIAFVNWVTLPSNIVIKFTDGGFNGTSPNSAYTALNARGSESFVIWKNTGGPIAPGTVIRIVGTTTNFGTATDASSAGTALDGLAGSGEQVFAYQGAALSGNNPDYSSTSATATFTGNILYGINMQGSGGATTWLTSGTANSNTSYLPTELNVTNGNIVIAASAVGAQYTGTRSALGSILAYRALVNNQTNWTKVTSGDVTIDLTAFTVNPNVATQIAVTAINAGINPSTDTPFNVTIEARDALNAPSSVGVDTDFLVTLLTGTGAIGGTVTGTMTAGNGTMDITGVTYNTAETGVSVQVSATAGMSLTAGNSATFTVDPAATQLAFVGLETYVYTANNVPTFTVQARRPDNSVDVNYTGNAIITLSSGSGNVLGTLVKPFAAGIATFNDISFDLSGVKQLDVNAGVLPAATSANITVSDASLVEVILPEYMEGKTSTNSNRVPVAYRVTLNGLKPNSTFRYYNSMVIAADGATSNGAGNAIFANPSSFVRSDATSLSSPGNYGEFTTDGTGSYTGWFITEPTGNSRFTPGNDVYGRIMLNNGNDGTATTLRLTTTNTLKVLEFGALANQGTALRGSSGAPAKNFVFLYNNTTGSGRPTSGSFIESDGSLNDNTNNSYSPFYANNVDGVAGAYGMIIPNTLANGIQRIEQRQLSDGALAGCASTDADGIWPGGANTVNPTGGITTPRVILSTDAPLIASPEICGNYIDDNCDGNIDELCPGNFANDVPGGASTVAYSSNVTYPNCYPINGDNTIANNSAESGPFSGPDSWYKFVAQSNAVSITMNSTTMDDALALYSKSGITYTLIDSENASSGDGDFERLNVSGLTPGVTYYVSAGAASGAVGGAFTLCIQHLMPSGCSYVTPVGGFGLCNNYKAIYRGSVGQGVTYNFNFTGVGGGASGTTVVTGTNGLIVLSNPTLALRYGGIYNVQVDVNYALLNSAGGTENISVLGNIASANCSGVTIMAQPLIEVKLSQRCPAVLLRSNYLIGTPVPGSPNACGAISYTYEFTQVVSCGDNTTVGMPTEYTTQTSNPYLALGNLAYQASSGAWSVRIRPNFSYGNGTYGPAQLVSVNNTAASVMMLDEMMDDTEKEMTGSFNAAIYPNPNAGGLLNLNLTDVTADFVLVRVMNNIGQVIYTERFNVDGSLNTVVNFTDPLSAGLYLVEFNAGGEVMTQKMIVQK